MKKLSNLTFSSRQEANQQYHAGQILHRNWNFMELGFPQGHQCPLPSGLLCLLRDINVLFHRAFYVCKMPKALLSKHPS